MSRPSDWWVLDLEGDPTSGDPSAVRVMARSWGSLAEDAEFAEQRIGSLLGDGVVGARVGEAGEAFRDKTGDLPDQLGKGHRSYRWRPRRWSGGRAGWRPEAVQRRWSVLTRARWRGGLVTVAKVEGDRAAVETFDKELAERQGWPGFPAGPLGGVSHGTTDPCRFP